MTDGFLRLKEADKGAGGAAKEQDAPHAPCISRDIIPNLPRGLDLMGEEIEI